MQDGEKTQDRSLPIFKAPPGHEVKPPVDPATLTHRQLRGGDFWRTIPAYADVDEATFLDHRWQSKNSITRPDKLLNAVRQLASPEFIADAEEGFHHAPMSVRVSPYILALIDWDNPYEDPLRRQFVPLGSRLLPDHPKLDLDSLHEQADSPTPGLTHRYPDKALFLTLDTCPVYCRYCTRSYAVGTDTDEVHKVSLKAKADRWDNVFAYIESRPEIEDIVISGGDSYNLRAEQIRRIGERLLAIPHIRRMRFASKGPAVMPQKILTDDEWFSALADVVAAGRKAHKDVCLHTHFNHPNEITEITERAMNRLMEAGIHVRNQSVLLRGVNDDPDTLEALFRGLVRRRVRPYYLLQADPVRGTGHLRTPIATGLHVMERLQGRLSGIALPKYIVDTPGGRGKVPVLPDTVVRREGGTTTLRTFRGEEVDYVDPPTAPPTNPPTRAPSEPPSTEKSG